MRTSRAVLLITAVLLVVPTAATAKGIKAVTVCGASGCQGYDRASDFPWLLGGNVPIDAPDRPAPYYDVRMTIGHGDEVMDEVKVAYLPSLRALRGSDQHGDPAWSRVSAPQSLRALSRATRGIAPHPASRLEPLGRDKAPPAVRVVEVFEPAKDARPAASGDGDGVIPWVLGAAAAALVVGMGLVTRRRTRIPRFPAG